MKCAFLIAFAWIGGMQTVVSSCRATPDPIREATPTPDGASIGNAPALTTSELVLLSPSGSVLAKLAPNDAGEASLQLYAAGHPGEKRMDVGLGLFGTPTISLYDGISKETCSLTLTNEGEPGEPSITLAMKRGAKGTSLVKIVLTRQYEPLFVIVHEGKTKTLSLVELMDAGR